MRLLRGVYPEQSESLQLVDGGHVSRLCNRIQLTVGSDYVRGAFGKSVAKAKKAKTANRKVTGVLLIAAGIYFLANI